MYKCSTRKTNHLLIQGRVAYASKIEVQRGVLDSKVREIRLV